MPLLAIIVLLVGNLLSPGQENQGVDLRLQDILTDRELRDYQRTPRYRNRISMFKKVFDRNSNLLERYVKANDLGKSSNLLLQIQAMCNFVEQETNQTEDLKELRSKQVKQLEIRLRRLAKTIRDLQVTRPWEHIDQFEVTVQAVDHLRTLLLHHLLGEQSSMNSFSEFSTSDRLYKNPNAWIFSVTRATLAPAEKIPRPNRDRFTDEEYTDVQMAQELPKRVKVFLGIAESRLEEIQRRIDKQEWTEKEDNPLAFYTYQDMVHAYLHAIDGIMTNIDDKVIYKTASREEIEESLKALNKNISEFIPQLKLIKDFALKLQDQPLYKKLLEAEEVSIAAQKGSLYGLGAPP